MKQYVIVGALLWAAAANAQYHNDFESWPIMAEGSWTLPGPGGTYTSDGCYVNFGNESSGLRKVGFNDSGDALYLPPVDHPGVISFWARNSIDGSTAWMAVQYHNGDIWVTAASFGVNSTTYRSYDAVAEYAGEAVPLRIRMSTYGNSVFMDDLSVSTFVPLPVELAGFSAAARPGRGVALHWRTLTESANDRFDILRSPDGAAFTPIGSVPGAGASSLPRNYSFLDPAPRPGPNYYRLRQVDLDGTETLSEVRAVTVGEGDGELVVYPNPVGETLTAVFSSSSFDSELSLLDQNGSVVKKVPVPPGQTSIALEVSELSAGYYLLQLIKKEESVVERIVKGN